MKTQKCRECGTRTKQKDDICFNCEVIVGMIKAFETGVSLHEPILGKQRKLEILSYKITKL